MRSILSIVVLYLSTSVAAAPKGKRAVICPEGFRNVVFNGPANDEPNWPGRFNDIQQYGVDNWIGFTMDPNGAADAAMNAGQMRLVMEPSQIPAAVSLVSGQAGELAPKYLAIFNEPDLTFTGTPLTSAADAAAAVQPLLAAYTTTQFISPAPAYSWSSYLPDFFANCQCEAQFPIIAMHLYQKDPTKAISMIQDVHNQFPTKHIWLTEIAPASDPAQGCMLDPAGVIDWMNTVLSWAAQSGYVDKVFWNSGEYGTIYPDNPTLCNPSLTNMDSTPTDLLLNYARLCLSEATS
ncbi:MAG: hypothetical protein M4579_006542 [Chaenotheca gracillima]|nr:MAG: hypothetical protein M4579_006542 [Chaenotheca gracillima]